MTSDEAIAEAVRLIRETEQFTYNPEMIRLRLEIAQSWMSVAETIATVETLGGVGDDI